jgi:hypothetical protein
MRDHSWYVSNHKEDVMSVKILWMIGFLSLVPIMTGTTVVRASDSSGVNVQRVDVIEHSNETVAQTDSVKAGGEWTRVDVIEHIGSRGPGYAYTKSLSH